MKELKKTNLLRKWCNLTTVFWIFVAVAVIICTIVAVVPNNDTVPVNNEHCTPLNDNWLLESENRLINLPDVVEVPPNESVTISRQLPDVFKTNTVISFVSSLQSVRVEVGGEVIYEYCQNPDRYFQVQPPPAWHIMRLSQDMAGQTVRITYDSPYQRYAGVLNGIMFGSKFAIFSDFIGSRLLSIVLCVSVFILAVFTIAVCAFLRNKIVELRRLLYLGVAAILISLWSICETKAMQIFTENVQLIMFVTFLSIMLFPIALLLFFRPNFTGKIRTAYNLFILAFALYFFVNVTLQVFNIINLNDMFLLLLGLIGGSLILIFASVIYSYFKNRNPQSRFQILAVFFLLAFGLVDMYRYLFQNLSLTSYSDTAMFSRIGILLMIFTLGFSSVKQVLFYYSESTKADAYRALSYTDSLSGLKNRTYFTEIYPSLFRGAINIKSYFAVIMVDIDNFKSYNDHYGHAAGDHVIQSVATAVKTAVRKSVDSAIRYGGEEFLILMPEVDPSTAVEAAKRIKQSLDNMAIRHNYSTTSEIVTVSQGIYSAIPVEGDTIAEFIDLADKALYSAKRNGKNNFIAYDSRMDEYID